MAHYGYCVAVRVPLDRYDEWVAASASLPKGVAQPGPPAPEQASGRAYPSPRCRPVPPAHHRNRTYRHRRNRRRYERRAGAPGLPSAASVASAVLAVAAAALTVVIADAPVAAPASAAAVLVAGAMAPSDGSTRSPVMA